MIGKAIVLAASLAALLVFVAGSCIDVAPAQSPQPAKIDPSPPAEDEPITGVAVQPVPGSESVRHDPFTPYAITAPDDPAPRPTWSYADLTAEEKIVADRGRDPAEWAKVHDAYARASQELAQHARVEAAEHRLGLDSLSGTGVVP